MDFIGKSETKLIKGKSKEISGKLICPIIQISTQKDIKGDISGAEVIPIAVIIEEDSERFILSLNHEDVDLDEILEKIKI